MTDAVVTKVEAVAESGWSKFVAYVKANHVAVIVGAVLYAAIKGVL